MSNTVAGVVHNSDPSLLTQWAKLIGDYVALLNSHQASGLYLYLIVYSRHHGLPTMGRGGAGG